MLEEVNLQTVLIRILNHSTMLFIGMSIKRKRRGNGSIYMSANTILYGMECPDCLRWYVPYREGSPCCQCSRWGIPLYPNRVRFFALREGISLREVQYALNQPMFPSRGIARS